jgi:hypothetical protein
LPHLSVQQLQHAKKRQSLMIALKLLRKRIVYVMKFINLFVGVITKHTRMIVLRVAKILRNLKKGRVRNRNRNRTTECYSVVVRRNAECYSAYTTE